MSVEIDKNDLMRLAIIYLLASIVVLLGFSSKTGIKQMVSFLGFFVWIISALVFLYLSFVWWFTLGDDKIESSEG